MKLDKQSIDNILKGATEVMVYGMDTCDYDDVSTALNDLGIQVHRAVSHQLPSSSSLPFSHSTNVTRNSAKQDLSDRCKNTLINLILENYKRSKAGKPIIPLLFCIEFESGYKNKKLDVSRLFKTECSITNKELRRCYRIISETTPEIQRIAMETFKFVRVKQNPSDAEEYFLQELPPFWENDEFKTKWQARISNTDRDSQKRANETPKKYQWKNELISSIRLFDANHTTGSTAATWHLPCVLF